jgi:hypothetical protein
MCLLLQHGAGVVLSDHDTPVASHTGCLVSPTKQHNPRIRFPQVIACKMSIEMRSDGT